MHFSGSGSDFNVSLIHFDTSVLIRLMSVKKVDLVRILPEKLGLVAS